MSSRAAQVPVVRGDEPDHDVVVREEPLTVQLAGRTGPGEAVWTTMRTPGADHDLALGWCVCEGIVTDIDDVLDVHHCDEHGAVDPNTITVRLDGTSPPQLQTHQHRVATAACGLCGRDHLDALLDRCAPSPRPAALAGGAVQRAIAELPAHQPLFAATGGAHAAGLADDDGQLLVVREDVGRHNAVDAVIGAATRDRVTASILVLSGRAGVELVAKAVVARIPVVVAVGAATDLAVAAANAAGLTLVTFAGHPHGGTVVSHAHRLRPASTRS